MIRAGPPAGRRPRTAALATAAVVLAGWVLVSDDPAPQHTYDGPAFGVQFHGMWSDYTDDEREEVLDRLVEAGVEWVRIDLSWAMLQPESGSEYSTWGTDFADRVIEMAERRGLEVLGMFWLTPSWANDGAGERAAPTDPEDYARAAAWVAERYEGRIAAWEIWNEPNDANFLVGEDPVVYAGLLRAAYPAIKEAAPDAQVVFGGTVYNDAEWIGRVYEAGAGNSFDVMATHPYQAVANLAPDAPDDGTLWRLAHVDAVRDVMRRHGDAGKPVWFTEFGWSSHDQNSAGTPNWQLGVSRETQADNLARTLELVTVRYPYVTNVFWYRERDAWVGDPQNDNYGLLDLNLQPKPAWERLRMVLRGR